MITPNLVSNQITHRRIDLREWQPREVMLSPAEIADLLKFSSDVVQIQAHQGGVYRLQPGAIVGQIRVGTIDLRILPKIPLSSLLAILVEVYELAKLKPELIGYQISMDVADLLAQIFLKHVELVIQQGLKRTYIQREEELIAVRGRLDLLRTFRLHLQGKPKAYCHYEDFTLDGPENAMLLAALTSISANRVFPAIRRNLAHRLGTAFLEVNPILPHETSLDALASDRINQHYFPALPLAQVILQGRGMTQEFGSLEADGFLLNMNVLFEKFVHRRLEKILLADKIQVKAQEEFLFDVKGQAHLKPDLIIQDHQGHTIVADTKYKIGTKAEPSDLYQMLTYCRVLQVSKGVLITVGTGIERCYEVKDGTTTIHVVPVDLSGTPADIDISMESLAVRMKDLLQHQ